MGGRGDTIGIVIRSGGFGEMTSPASTTRNAGLVSCEVCRLVSRAASREEAGFCRRCALLPRRHRLRIQARPGFRGLLRRPFFS